MSINRRKFLQTTTAAGIGASLGVLGQRLDPGAFARAAGFLHFGQALAGAGEIVGTP